MPVLLMGTKEWLKTESTATEWLNFVGKVPVHTAGSEISSRACTDQGPENMRSITLAGRYRAAGLTATVTSRVVYNCPSLAMARST